MRRGHALCVSISAVPLSPPIRCVYKPPHRTPLVWLRLRAWASLWRASLIRLGWCLVLCGARGVQHWLWVSISAPCPLSCPLSMCGVYQRHPHAGPPSCGCAGRSVRAREGIAAQARLFVRSALVSSFAVSPLADLCPPLPVVGPVWAQMGVIVLLAQVMCLCVFCCVHFIWGRHPASR